MINKIGSLFNSKAISFVIAAAIIALIITSGPASAFRLGFDLIGDNIATVGEDVKVKLGLDVQSSDSNLPVQKIEFIVTPQGNYSGTGSLTCTFDAHGNKLSACDGVTIQSSHPEFGYGYGYGEFQNSSYNFGYGYGTNDDFGFILTFDSAMYGPGSYDGQFKVYMGDETFDSRMKGMMHILPAANLYVKDPYPKESKNGMDYVFVCETPGFKPQSYTWYYGDGQKLVNVTNGDTYHIYTQEGTYNVSCTAQRQNGKIAQTADLQINVDF